MIAADEYHAERHAKHDIFKGRLRSTKAKAVVILGKGDKEDLIVFKSSKVPGCRKFNVDLEVFLVLKPVLLKSSKVDAYNIVEKIPLVDASAVYNFRVKVKHPACLVQIGMKS